MEAVDAVIQRAAQAVYRRIFETSELLAANRAANLFIQRLYQASAGRVDERTRDIADTLVRKGSSATLARYDSFLSSDDNSYAYHYRAQRIVYDCLSANVERISKGEPRVATAEEMELRIKKTSVGECEPWLANQFGALGPGSRREDAAPGADACRLVRVGPDRRSVDVHAPGEQILKRPDQLTPRSNSAVAASAGKNDSIASSDSVTSTGVPKIVVVENSDKRAGLGDEAQRHHDARIVVVHRRARRLGAARRRIGARARRAAASVRRPPLRRSAGAGA